MVRKYLRYRIININLNIIIASILSIILAAIPVYFVEMLTKNMFLMGILAFLIDAIIDIAIFAFLHLLVNLSHSKILVAFDFALIQGHRFILSILYFAVAFPTHVLLMHLGTSNVLAFLISYTLALIVTRTTHTIYGIKSGLFKELNK